MSQSGQDPHREERNRSPKGPARFRNKTTPTRTKNAVHLSNREPPIRENGKKTRRNQNIETRGGMGKLQDVVALKPAVVQPQGVSFLACPGQLARGTIDAEHRNFPETFCQSARIKSWSAAQLDNLFPWSGLFIGPQGTNHSRRIVAEKSFATKDIKPREMLKQTVRRPVWLGCAGSGRLCFRDRRRRQRQNGGIGERG